MEWVARDAWWGEPLMPGSAGIRAEVPHAVEREWAVTLSDVVLRRLALGFGPDLGHAAAVAVAGVLVDRLRWDDERVHQELQAFDTENDERRLPNVGGDPSPR